jgi:hypothetical protein
MISDLKQALQDPEVLDILSTALASKVSATLAALKEEVVELRDQVKTKDDEITHLREEIDSLEQYSRRNSIRIAPVPETADGARENTEDIVRVIAASVGVTLPEEAIDRCHRVGRKPTMYESFTRPILVKLTSYKHKEALMRARKKLRERDASKLFPEAAWPALPASASGSASASSNGSPSTPRLYFNDDLTKTRSEVAATGRLLKRTKKIEDTWVRDGNVFVRCDGVVKRANTKREMDSIARPGSPE